jgi:hypothetical protein
MGLWFYAVYHRRSEGAVDPADRVPRTLDSNALMPDTSTAEDEGGYVKSGG